MSKPEDFDVLNGILKKYTGSGGNVVIPDGVTKIKRHVFAAKTELTSVVIPEGVTEICEGAFCECGNLCTVRLPESLESIGKHAFLNTGIQKITLPKHLKELGEDAFCYNRDGKFDWNGKVVYPSEIKTQWGSSCYHADERCLYRLTEEGMTLVLCFKRGIHELTVPEGTVCIASGAFAHTPYLHKIILPESLQTIASQAFRDVPLYKLHIPAATLDMGPEELDYLIRNVKKEGYNGPYYVSTQLSVAPDNPRYAVENDCLLRKEGSEKILLHGLGDDITDIKIPEGTTEIGKNAFSQYRGICTVTLPDSLKCIRENAFPQCENLEELRIPSDVEEIEKGAFGADSLHGCKKLRKVFFEGKRTHLEENAFSNFKEGRPVFYCDPDSPAAVYARACGISVPNVTAVDAASPAAPELLFEYKIDRSKRVKLLKYIGLNTTVRIPATVEGCPVTSFHKDLFRNNTIIEKVIWPPEILEIPKELFFGCTELTEVCLPDTLTAIGEKAFRNCRNLHSITIPEHVTQIGSKAFECAENSYGTWEYWTALENIKGVSGSQAQFYAAENNIPFLRVLGENKDPTFEQAQTEYQFHEIPGGYSLDRINPDCSSLTSDTMVIPDEILGKPVLELSADFHRKNRRNQNGYSYEDLPYRLVIGPKLQHILCPLYDRKVKELVISEQNPYLVSDDFMWYEAGGTVLADCWNKPSPALNYRIPEGTLKIREGALSCMEKTKSVFPSIQFPESIQELGENALQYKDSWSQENVWAFYLGKVVPGSYADHYFSDKPVLIMDSRLTPAQAQATGAAFDKHMENGAYVLDKYLLPESELVFPEKVDGYPVALNITNNFFSEDYPVTSITLSNSITEFPEKLLQNCPKLEELKVSENHPVFSCRDGVLYTRDRSALVAYPSGKQNSVFKVPDSVTEIYPGAFRQQEYFGLYYLQKPLLQQIILPSALKSIPDYCFENRSNLTNVNLPNQITLIGENAFYKTGLKEITLPASVHSIGKKAFALTALSSVVVPETVESVDICCFAGVKDITVHHNLNSEGPEYDPQDQKLQSKIGFIGLYSELPGKWTYHSSSGYIRNLYEWKDHVITVRDSQTKQILYRVSMYAENESGELQRTLADSWGANACFDFARADGAFDLFSQSENKMAYAILRMMYPRGLSDENRKIFTDYLIRVRLKFVPELIRKGQLDVLTGLEDCRLITKSNLHKFLAIAQEEGKTEFTAYLLQYQAAYLSGSADSFTL